MELIFLGMWLEHLYLYYTNKAYREHHDKRDKENLWYQQKLERRKRNKNETR